MAATHLQLHLAAPLKPQTHLQKAKTFATNPAICRTKLPTVRCSAAAAATPAKRSYNITLLPGDGIGPEIISISKDVLQFAASLEGKIFSFLVPFFNLISSFCCGFQLKI